MTAGPSVRRFIRPNRRIADHLPAGAEIAASRQKDGNGEAAVAQCVRARRLAA